MNQLLFLTMALLAAANPGDAWAMSPQKCVQQATAAFGIAAMLSTAPMNSNAAVDYVGGTYTDLNHPDCQHTVRVEGKKATISGSSACPKGRGSDSLVGKVSGQLLKIDFSPNGGPKDATGVFEGNGIVWPDGNKWTLEN